MKTIAIVPAAGSGRRLELKAKKPFVLLGGKPLVTYALRALDSCEIIDGIVIAAERTCVKRFRDLVKRFKFKKVTDVVVGGHTRHESVRNCLKSIGHPCDIIVIHDGGRPFAGKALIERSARMAKRYGASITAIPEVDTVKLADNELFVKKTLDRNTVFRAQTPQSFRYDLIKRAYSLKGPSPTDDSSLVESLGGRIKIIEGSRRNIKITTKEDLKLAEALL